MNSFILIGSEEKTREYLETFKKENKILPYLISQYSEFKIADARALQKNISLKLSEGEKRLVIIERPTGDSQNALLKTVEELTDSTFLFFLAASAEELIPTILSRCAVILLESEKKAVDNDIISKIQTADPLMIPDFLSDPLEIADLEKTVLALREILLDDVKKGKADGKIFQKLKKLSKNTKLAKTNNLNKKLVLENSFIS